MKQPLKNSASGPSYMDWRHNHPNRFTYKEGRPMEPRGIAAGLRYPDMGTVNY